MNISNIIDKEILQNLAVTYIILGINDPAYISAASKEIYESINIEDDEFILKSSIRSTSANVITFLPKAKTSNSILGKMYIADFNNKVRSNTEFVEAHRKMKSLLANSEIYMNIDKLYAKYASNVFDTNMVKETFKYLNVKPLGINFKCFTNIFDYRHSQGFYIDDKTAYVSISNRVKSKKAYSSILSHEILHFYLNNINLEDEFVKSFKERFNLVESFELVKFYIIPECLNIAINNRLIYLKHNIVNATQEQYSNAINYFYDKLLAFEKTRIEFSIFIKDIKFERGDSMIESTILLETAENKRTFKCPYCNFRGTREDLVFHVMDEHEDMIPEDFTAARVVFNFINKKTKGKCIICGSETKWNEDSWKYERLCSDKCRNTYAEQMKRNMINVHGRPHLLNSPEQQTKMLANRSISGQYTFSDGSVRTYTGSYEKNALEFFDKVMNIPGKDILTPGPIIEYDFKGQKLTWITDIFYVPFNLVFDVKDGGSNKNTHPDMQEYRDKQIAKEEAIAKCGLYNYIRLTDNDFSQMIDVMMQIKNSMHSDDKSMMNKKIISINEGAYMPTDPLYSKSIKNKGYIVAYSRNPHMVEGFGFSTDLSFDTIFVYNEEKGCIYPTDKTYFEDCFYNVFAVQSDDLPDRYMDILESCLNKKGSQLSFIGSWLETFDNTIEDLGVSGFDLSKFNIDKIFKEMASLKVYDQLLSEFSDIVVDPTKYKMIVMESSISEYIDKFVGDDTHIELREDYNGYYLLNTINGKRGLYHETVQKIPRLELHILRG